MFDFGSLNYWVRHYNMFLKSSKNMGVLFVLLLSLFVFLGCSIQIPLKQGQFKCHDQTIKIDIDFPSFKNWQTGDYYSLTLRNTQTHELQKQERKIGRFRRQISVDQQVIYELCFELISQHEVVEELMIDYNADTYHMADKNSIKIPDSLLKVEDMRQIYSSSYMLTELAKNYRRIQADWDEKEQADFQESERSESTIMAISYIEMGLILVITGFQCRLIKKKLEDNQSPFGSYYF